jgi:hypothetical protein
MKIGVITYSVPHRKTQDVVFRMLSLGYEDITLLTLIYEFRKPRSVLFNHRPVDCLPVDPQDIALRFRTIKIAPLIRTDLGQYDKILIAGSGILPPKIARHKIINSHPGYLPNVRGLDALKWAILEGQPIGVTTHLIGTEADTGILIQRRILLPGLGDTFHSIAWRQYEIEIEMLVDALEKEPDGEKLTTEYPLHGRMTIKDEIRMSKKLTAWNF